MAKPRYITEQRDGFSCGAIALMNLYKWLGHNITFKKNHKRFQKLVRCSKGGTHRRDLLTAMRKIPGIKVETIVDISVDYMISCLEAGKSIILVHGSINYDKYKNGKLPVAGHVCFIPEYENGRFRLINARYESVGKHTLCRDYLWNYWCWDEGNVQLYPCAYIVRKTHKTRRK